MNTERPTRDMATLLAKITEAMFVCDMPDNAMNGLFDAHDAVVDELVIVAGCIEDKQSAIETLNIMNENNIFDAKIARIRGSMELDLSLAA